MSGLISFVWTGGRLPATCRLFSLGVIFTHALISLARSSIPEEKGGTTRSLNIIVMNTFKNSPGF